MVLETDLCVKEKVALPGVKIVPEADLYNGAQRMLISLVYEDVFGPSNR